MKWLSRLSKEYIILGMLITVGLFMVVGFANRSLSIHSPIAVKEKIIKSITTLFSPSLQTTKLYAGGDIMFSRGIGYYNKKNNRTIMFSGSAFNPIREWCQNDCLLVFNLESLFSATPNDSPDSTFHFAANTKNIDILHRMKENNELYLSLANNHARNVGKAGIVFTKSFLKQQGIFSRGATDDTIETGYNIEIIDRDSIRICLSSYSYDGAVIGKGAGQYTIEKGELWRIERDVSYMKQQYCDVKVANIHRGSEYDIAPTVAQRELGREMIDSGIDLILGNHSHVPGFIEQYNDKYIVYSMGNHIFDQDRGYKTCDTSNYDTIYDYALGRCTVPTYIGMNLGFTIMKSDNTQISLDYIEFFSIKKGIQYPLDDKTKEEMKREVMKV